MLQLVYILLTVFTLSAWAQGSDSDFTPAAKKNDARPTAKHHRHAKHAKSGKVPVEEQKRALEPNTKPTDISGSHEPQMNN